MEDGRSNPTAHERLFVAAAPVLLISMGYIDAGKWVSCIDSGARFGNDLVPFVLFFNLFGILCYYLSAYVGLITGKNLAQICSEEYDRRTCIFLGVQAELSDYRHCTWTQYDLRDGLVQLFSFDSPECSALSAFFHLDGELFNLCYLFGMKLKEHSRVKVLVIYMAALALFCYMLGILISVPEFPVPTNGFISKLSGESAFALMSLLGANVMPHYFYVHSSIVQRYQRPRGVPKSVWSHDNFIVTLTISSGIFLVNYLLMNSAASAFYSTSVGMINFQDSMSLVDQAFKDPVILFTSFVVLCLANQITALIWEYCAEGGETMLHDFFKMDLPVWLHRATVRIFAIVTALYCLWHSGTEGMYHMLICAQVIVALLLPSSMIPLFRIASSRKVMGLFKISPVLEFVVLIAFMGMLGLEIIFMVEMIFGKSDWVSNLRWNMGNTTSIAYVLLLGAACISLSFMAWLAATPLRSTNARADSQPWSRVSQQIARDSYTKIEGNDVVDTEGREDEPFCKHESPPSKENSLCSHRDMLTSNYDINLPETIMDSVHEPYLTTIEENLVVNVPMSVPRGNSSPQQSVASGESISVCNVVVGPSDVPLSTTIPMKSEATEPAEKTLRIEGDSQIEKDDEEGNAWDPEGSSKDALGVDPSATQEGLGSLRSLNGKGDEGGTSIGSLSRLSGLGRAARRQLAAALDEFWGQLYDFHGQITPDARAKKLDLLLGLDSKPSQLLTKANSEGKDFGMPIQPLGRGISDNPMNMSLNNASEQQKFRNFIESACKFPSTSGSIWSNQTPWLDRYPLGSNRRMLDASWRRYQSVRLPASSDSLEHQPATVHGYEIASYLNQIAKNNIPNYVNGQLGSAPQKSPSLIPNNYGVSHPFSLGEISSNGFSSMQPSSFQNLAVQRNNPLQSDKQHYDPCTATSVENLGSQNNAKKYHSLPSISGLNVPLRNPHLSDRSTQWEIPKTSTRFGVSVGRTTYEQLSYTSVGSGTVAPLAFDELSPSRAYKDAISLGLNSGSNTGSLWSRQPFEQFGVANKTMSLGAEEPGTQTVSVTPEPEPLSLAEIESKLLQSLRLCILKLLKLEGSEWLFRPNDAVDEDLIDRIATRERFFYEVESQDLKQAAHLGEPQYSYSERKSGSPMGFDDAVLANLVSSVPQCGDGCVWKVDLVVSFGVWCIHRILELSLTESRPELWGKYTYVLNRLQGVIDLAFFKPRTPMSPCFCLQVPASFQIKSSPSIPSSPLPPAARPARGTITTAATLLELIKDVEIAISGRKGRSGTAAGDVAFPKGKENLASVLKRYKRRLSNKPVGANEGGLGSRKLQ
ncbi:hypothetical protein Cgig2_018122 [Carnegiea gigantea]|uniref:Uncharacterized protein n=1 Tax=Carnegiea gigantea TaxID=171969 RepID=A0A9Q1JGM3_9CARY|nr:hypothetical protein Cgig2_018122 [Carnegiea gigantea]